MGRTQCLVIGLSVEGKTCKKVAQATSSCRTWEVAMSSRQIYKVIRVFGNSSNTMSEFPGV